jgi:hypothetical protein
MNKILTGKVASSEEGLGEVGVTVQNSKHI